MSIILLTVLVLLVWALACTLMKRFVRWVRVVGACILGVSLVAFIVQSRETIAHQGNSSGTLHSPMLSGKPTLNAANSTHDPDPVAYVTAQSISKEDHNFLDEILQGQNQDDPHQGNRAPTPIQNVGMTKNIGSDNKPVLKVELVTNNKTLKRAGPVTHSETVKRAELVQSRRQ